jgi:hypothetical protein
VATLPEAAATTAAVVGTGWHDICLRWDISTPQRVVARLEELPGQGSLKQPGKKLFAERDRFGKWQHVLGPKHVLLAYTVESPSHGLIRRLELQAHLGDDGEDDLCPTNEFSGRWAKLQTLMGILGVLPVEDPSYVRVDPAVDVAYSDPIEGQKVLEALRYARWPYRWYTEWQGPPPYTTVAIKSGTKIVGRVYCRNTKLRNQGERWGKLRFEREQRFTWRDRRPIQELASATAASTFWVSVFGLGRASGVVRRIEREVQTVKLIERVQLGELTTSQFEQMTGFLDAERLGLTSRIYTAETARRRKSLARKLGVAIADGETEPLDVALDDLLVVPRSAWASETWGAAYAEGVAAAHPSDATSIASPSS